MASKDKRSNKNIRGDKIMWVDGRETGVSNIKFLMNQVRFTIPQDYQYPTATCLQIFRSML